MPNKFIEKKEPGEQKNISNENTAQPDSPVNNEEQAGKTRKTKKSSTFWNIIGGDFLTKKAFVKQFPLILLLFVYSLIYIGVSRIAESDIKKMTQSKKELKGYRNQQIYLESELMKKSKQSQVEQGLDSLGIKASTTPVILLYKNSKK